MDNGITKPRKPIPVNGSVALELVHSLALHLLTANLLPACKDQREALLRAGQMLSRELLAYNRWRMTRVVLTEEMTHNELTRVGNKVIEEIEAAQKIAVITKEKKDNGSEPAKTE